MFDGRWLILAGVGCLCLAVIGWVGFGIAGNEAAAGRVFAGGVALAIILGLIGGVMPLFED